MCTGGGGVSQRLPAESCVGWVSGGSSDPSRVLGVCWVTATVLRVTLMSWPRVLRSGGVWGRRRSVSSAATSVALVGMVPVRMVFWMARRLIIPCGPMSLVVGAGGGGRRAWGRRGGRGGAGGRGAVAPGPGAPWRRVPGLSGAGRRGAWRRTAPWRPAAPWRRAPWCTATVGPACVFALRPP